MELKSSWSKLARQLFSRRYSESVTPQVKRNSKRYFSIRDQTEKQKKNKKARVKE